MADSREDTPSRVIFLLGAGASVEAGIPDTFRMVRRFEKDAMSRLDERVRAAARVLLSRLGHKGGREGPDIERILSAAVALAERNSATLRPFATKFLEGIGPERDFSQLAAGLRAFIRDACTVSPSKLEYLYPLADLRRHLGPLTVFSVNYDMCIESVCDNFDLNYTDGFDVTWNPSLFESASYDVRIFKLHGSLVWFSAGSKTDRPGRAVKIPLRFSQDLGRDKIRYYTGDAVEDMMIYPQIGKDRYTEPYARLFFEFNRQLDDSRILVVVGYSFRDEELRLAVAEALRKNKDLYLIIIDPEAGKRIADQQSSPSFRPFLPRIILWPTKTGDALRDGALLQKIRQVEEARDVEMEWRKAKAAGHTELANQSLKGLMDKLQNLQHYAGIERVLSDAQDFHFGKVPGHAASRSRNVAWAVTNVLLARMARRPADASRWAGAALVHHSDKLREACGLLCEVGERDGLRTLSPVAESSGLGSIDEETLQGILLGGTQFVEGALAPAHLGGVLDSNRQVVSEVARLFRSLGQIVRLGREAEGWVGQANRSRRDNVALSPARSAAEFILSLRFVPEFDENFGEPLTKAWRQYRLSLKRLESALK